MNSEKHPPRPSLLCIHGAATGAWVWSHWRRALGARGWEVNVLDLRGHGQSMPIDLATVTMDDYLWDIGSVVDQIAAARGRQPILAGWDIGGMLCLMYASQQPATPALMLLEPSPPLEVAGRPEQEYVRRFAGETFGPEMLGIHAGDREKSRGTLFDLSDEEIDHVIEKTAGVSEGGLIFRQALRGISLPAGSVQCPVLLLHGNAPEHSARATVQRQTGIYLGAEVLAMPAAGHWGVVMSGGAVDEAAPEVDRWLKRVSQAGEES